MKCTHNASRKLNWKRGDCWCIINFNASFSNNPIKFSFSSENVSLSISVTEYQKIYDIRIFGTPGTLTHLPVHFFRRSFSTW